MFERWCTEPGAVSQLWQRHAGLLLCPYSRVSYPHTSTHTHALTHCQCVYLDTVRQLRISHRYKNPLLTDRCSACTADAGGDNAKSPCQTNMGQTTAPSSGRKSNRPITPLLLCGGSDLLYVMGRVLHPFANSKSCSYTFINVLEAPVTMALQASPSLFESDQ